MERLAASARIFRFGLFEANAGRSTLSRGGLRVRLQEQPFRVLLLLLERPGEITTREELRQHLWPEGTFVDFDGSLNVILKKLRAALDDDSDNPRFIETVPRQGYRFIAPVTVESMAVEPPTSVHGAVLGGPAELPTKKTAPVPNPPTGRPPLLLIYAVSAVMLLVLVLIGLGWYVRHRDFFRVRTVPMQPTAATVPVLRKSVAVLGFHNLSGKAEDGWLATAFSEMLSTELSAGEKLRLVSGEDVANVRLSSPWSQSDTLGKETTARIGTALNSDVLVLGSYASIGRPERRQVRIDVRLQNARTGEILAEVAEIGSSDNFFQLISRIGAKLRDRLGVPGIAETDEPSVVASLPSNPEAARFYTLGLARVRDYDASAAKDLLEQATKADPKFPLSHSMLARAWSQLGYEQKRKEEAKRALDLSANLPRVSRMLVEGDYYESLAHHEKAASTYQALFALFPDSVEYGLQLAAAQDAAGHGNQASGTLSQLRRLPPPASDDPRIDLLDARVGQTNDPARLALIRSAIRKATAQGKKLVYARAKEAECLNLLYGEHPDQASASCDDAYNIFLAAGNRLGAANTVRLMADRQGSEGHYQEAIATYQKALKILQELGEHEKTGAVLNNMAINFENEGELDRAERLYRQAKTHFEQTGDKLNTATALSNIADILYVRGDLPGAAKLYEQTLEIHAALDHGNPGYALYRLGDLRLAQGHLQDAHRLAQQAVDLIRADQSGYQYLTGAMLVLGEVSKAGGDLQGAQQQVQATLDIRQRVGETGLVRESQLELAGLAFEEGQASQAEPLLRAAIVEFEKEKGDPDTTNAYNLLSRMLQAQGKLEDARKAIQHAAQVGRKSSDPALTLPIAIQTARLEMAAAGQDAAGHLALATARQQLRSTIATAKKLGYYLIECEARLALGEAELKPNPTSGRSQLETLEKETHERGLELLSRKARLLLSANQSSPAYR
jgi:DNA-binding winged helix-turn-helix (wHTH) protein/tetratricopeptide (TPR) repeat protein/TolB-like protein